MSANPARVHLGTRRRLAWLAWVSTGVVLGAAVVLVAAGDDSNDVLRGSGVPAQQARAVSPFRGVELAGSNVVTVRVGDHRSVIVRGDDNLLSRVTTTVRSERLVIDTVESFSTRRPMRVEVTTPSLQTLALTGSGTVSAEGVRAKTLDVTLPGTGILRASGQADRLVVTLGGSGLAQLAGLVVRDARAVVAGSGRIDLTATRALDASLPGTGVINYGGNPAHVTTSVEGSGAVTRRRWRADGRRG